MFNFSKIDRHAGLVNRMADALDVDFAEELQRGRLMPQELRSAVFRCTNCSNPDSCEAWLEAHADGADDTPEYCRNRNLMAALRS